MAYPTDVATKHGFKKTSMDSQEDATACYELRMPENCHTQPLQQPSCCDFNRKIAKNGSATATITIKPEHLAHHCVEQDLLYPWMCFTSWFKLHRSQDKHFSVPPSV